MVTVSARSADDAPLFAPSIAWTALSVAVLCYLGARAGVWLSFPEAGAAVVFLPYAVLFTALVVSPARRWWICAVAGSLGTFLGHVDGGAAPSFALLTEFANVARALVAAAGVRRFAPGIGKFDDLRSMTALLVFAVGLGPCAGAFIGSTVVVSAGKTSDFWLTWEEWFLSNALAAVSICPVALTLIWSIRNRDESRAFRAAFVTRRFEEALVAAAFVAVAAGVFAFAPPELVARPARLYWPVPLLLWIAVRFPPAGIGSALLAVTCLTIWGAKHGRGPFVTASPTENLLNLQLFLIVLALPKLLLASVVVQSARTVQERLLADEQRQQLEAERRVAMTLQEADKRKDEFLAVLAHELRNPLAPAALTLETLRRKTPPASEAARAQELIARQLRHMSRLVDDLFDVSRITRGKIELRLETTDFRDAVKHGIETARPRLTEKRHELVIVLPEAPLHVRGDAIRLTQIVGNLVNNAARYTDEGGRIEVSVERLGNEAILRVRDNGIGIRADMIDDIFGLFVQVRGDRSTLRGGLGIGLSLVKQLTEMHGGRVVAESAGSGQGSTFTVTLPALEPLSLSTSSPPRADDEPMDFPLAILVVDDHVDAAKALAELLALWGHTTRVAHDGAAAMDAARAESPDVVLLDLDLPKANGYDVASALRRERDSSELLLVALSGFASEQHRERANAAGFDHHLVKPVDIAALRSLLRETAGRTTAAYRRTRSRATR